MSAAALQRVLNGIDPAAPPGDAVRAERAIRRYIDETRLREVGDRVRWYESPSDIREAKGKVTFAPISALWRANPGLTWTATSNNQHWGTAEQMLGRVRRWDWRPLEIPEGVGDAMETTDALLSAIAAGAFHLYRIPRPGGRLEWGVLRQPFVIRDDQMRLHNDQGPSIGWAEGQPTGYHIRGIAIDHKIITQPGYVTHDMIAREQNVEVRRVMLEKYGYDKWLTDMSAVVVAVDEHGKLWDAPGLPNEVERMRVVEVINATAEPDGSVRRYFLRVPPTTITPKAGIAWTFNMRPEDWAPTKET